MRFCVFLFGLYKGEGIRKNGSGENDTAGAVTRTGGAKIN
jgi:hypothetical protein